MKGINFTEAMFKAAVEGQKTQTRRIMKPQPIIPFFGNVLDDLKFLGRVFGPDFPKPRYKVGEKVYLKEPYSVAGGRKENPNGTVAFKYLPNIIFPDEQQPKWENDMPEKYARYFIEITDVRCERLQDISESDAILEGIYYIQNNGFSYPKSPLKGANGGYYTTAKAAYAALIDKIYGKGTWESNPYVWVYDFKLIKQ